MDDIIKKFLDDILFSIAAIDIHLQGTGDYRIYEESLTMQRAVEREIEIIGEAMNRILKLQPDIQITSAVKIVDQRNLIIHAYDIIDNEMIWDVR